MSRLATQPTDSGSIQSTNGVSVPEGKYVVEYSKETASAFSDFLPNVAPDSPVYLIQSVGRVPHRRGIYSLTLVTVVRFVGGNPEVLIWSENSGARK